MASLASARLTQGLALIFWPSSNSRPRGLYDDDYDRLMISSIRMYTRLVYLALSVCIQGSCNIPPERI